MVGQAEDRHFHSKREKYGRREGSWGLNKSKPEGKFHEILKLKNNSLWLNALCSRPMGTEALPFISLGQESHLLDPLGSDPAPETLPGTGWASEALDGLPAWLWTKATWPVESKAVVPPFETKAAVLMISESPLGSFLPPLEE